MLIAHAFMIGKFNNKIKEKNMSKATEAAKNISISEMAINIDTHSLKMHSAITQSSKNEKVVLIDEIEGAIRLFYVKQPVSL